MGTWVTDEKEMQGFIKELTELGYKVKASTIVDRGQWPAITVEGINTLEDYEDLELLLEDMGVAIIDLRKLRRSNGSKAIKFMLRYDGLTR